MLRPVSTICAQRFFALTILLTKNLLRSPTGRAWVAIRDSEIAAQSIQWCCNESGVPPYFGDYTAREDGSVFLNYEGQRYVIPDTLVLKGTNRTKCRVVVP